MLLALRLLRKYHNRHVQWCRSRSNIENPAAAASSQEAPSAKEANRLLPLLEQRISCITFGAPLIGNVALRECVNECGWSSCFHHVVTHGDSVPLLTFHKAFKHTKELLRSGSALLNQLSPLANVMERAWSTITGTADTDEWSRARRQRGTRRNGRIIPQGGWGAVLSQLTGNSSPSSSCDADPPSPVGSSPSTSTSSSRSSARSTSISSAVDHEEALRSGVSVFSSPADRMALEGAAALESTTQGSEGVESSSAREDELMFSAGATVAPFSSTASASREPPPLDYQCFGRYHFLRWQDLNYCSSIDHLTTMTILEEGSHGSLKEHHSVYGYNKALMMHLYTSPRPY